MAESSPSFCLNQASEGSFDNTDWWMVRQAGRPGQPDADPARASLCQAYWKPVFQYILRAGHSWHDAQDLTQEFFARVLKRNSLHTAAREKGKFRSFLLTLLKRFLADQCDRERCQKRGGGALVISLDSGDTEFRRRLEPIDRLDPETICEREWLAALLQDALVRLELECASRGKAQTFRVMKGLVTGEVKGSSEVAATLHLSEANVRVTVHRLRHRLRELLSEGLADSSSSRPAVKEQLLGVF